MPERPKRAELIALLGTAQRLLYRMGSDLRIPGFLRFPMLKMAEQMQAVLDRANPPPPSAPPPPT